MIFAMIDNLQHQDLSEIIRRLLGRWLLVPNKKKFANPNAPELLLKNILSMGKNDKNSSGYTVRFAKSNSPITLFSKNPTFGGNTLIRNLIESYGYERGNNQIFRHTINRSSRRGFFVTVDDNTISVTNSSYPDIVPAWSLDDIEKTMKNMNKFATIFGDIKEDDKGMWVRFDVAIEHSKFRLSEIKRGLAEGWISIVFDTRIKPNGKIEGKDAAFRIKTQDLGLVYANVTRIHRDK